MKKTMIVLAVALLSGAFLMPASARVGGAGIGGGVAGPPPGVGLGVGVVTPKTAVVAGPVGVGGAPVAAAVAYGTVVYTLPATSSTSCAQSVVSGVTYYNCGGTWYQPAMVNGAVQYTAVKPPA